MGRKLDIRMQTIKDRIKTCIQNSKDNAETVKHIPSEYKYHMICIRAMEDMRDYILGEFPEKEFWRDRDFVDADDFDPDLDNSL